MFRDVKICVLISYNVQKHVYKQSIDSVKFMRSSIRYIYLNTVCVNTDKSQKNNFTLRRPWANQAIRPNYFTEITFLGVALNNKLS